MKKRQGASAKQISVQVCRSWSSSFSRAMNTAGRAASAAAIQRAAETGTQVAYLKDGIVVKCNPESPGVK